MRTMNDLDGAHSAPYEKASEVLVPVVFPSPCEGGREGKGEGAPDNENNLHTSSTLPRRKPAASYIFLQKKVDRTGMSPSYWGLGTVGETRPDVVRPEAWAASEWNFQLSIRQP